MADENKTDSAPTEKTTKVKTIKMVRDKKEFPAGPHEADVHPDELTNYARGGWLKA